MAEGGLERETHFETLERQADAARFGMWVFLSSELLLFGGLFTLYAAYRNKWPQAFVSGIEHNTKLLGSTNTVVLITSSFLVALSVKALRDARARTAFGLLLGTLALALAFLVIKFTEYGIHFHEGIYPGGRGRHFEHAPLGEVAFYTLYYVSTGLHALHVMVGAGVLAWCAWRIRGRGLAPHALEIGAMYWHLVDVIWIFIWPIYYLMR